ncbi:MAG: LamG domain-containing protein, partial [Patescibacteria group bacterium]|nr:LamG domain-containing protein [Patescibacteria group bacterium]
ALGTSSTYELTSYFESDKYQQTAANSGNPDPTTYAIGSNLSITPFIHGLVADYAFDNPASGVGAITTDSSGWGNNGTLEDTTSTGTGPAQTSTPNCVSGSCYSFDGVDDYISTGNIPTSGFSSNQEISILDWVYINSNNSSQGTPSYDNGFFHVMVNTSGVTVYLNVDNSWTSPSDGPLSASYSIAQDAWHLVAFTYNQNHLWTIYVDGNKAGSTVFGSGLYPGGSINMGDAYGGSTLFGGLLDDIRIYNVALTQAQVQAIYNAEKS